MAGHEGQPLQVTVWMVTGWVMTGWLSLEALETTGQVTQIHARLTESATEKRNPAGQVECWSPARARRAPLLELEDDRLDGKMTGWVIGLDG